MQEEAIILLQRLMKQKMCYLGRRREVDLHFDYLLKGGGRPRVRKPSFMELINDMAIIMTSRV